MQSRIRDVRRAKKLTLADVAARCIPPTTAQTIGRLETGTRTLSIGWLNRIAAGLGVESSELVQMPAQEILPVAALLKEDGVFAPTKTESIAAPVISSSMIGIRVVASNGEYRQSDEIWLEKLEPADFAKALNRDVLVPRPAGRFMFARLIGREDGKLHLLPHSAGSRQQVVADPVWIARAVKLVRAL